jgi:AbrB family looped-hinge helix DNA binding protein
MGVGRGSGLEPAGEIRGPANALDFLTRLLTLRQVMKATITSKGQITIPRAVRRKLNLVAGTVLDFDEQADHLKAFKCADPVRMRSVVGIAKAELAGKSVSEWLDELRGPAELPACKRKR